MTRQLVFVHGRAQEHKDAVALKAEWMSAWAEGLRKNDLSIPIAESEIRFPYYGQTLYDLVAGREGEQVAEIIVRGDNAEAAQKEFIRSVLEEVRKVKKLDESLLREVVGNDVVERGPLNWEWLQGILRAVDRYVLGSSGASIAIATNDVYQYLRNPGIRDTLEEGVRQAMSPETQTVVVSHSLGTVVAYNLLRREGMSQRWNVPFFVTLGSPLGVTAIRTSLRPIKYPECVAKWFNAMDERDVVALYPLTKENFDIDPEIENKTNVDNHTTNRHGIAGYLNDKAVAKRIYDALTA